VVRPGKPNDLLRSAREGLLSPSGSGAVLSRRELAEAVNAEVYQSTGQRTALSDNYVYALECGDTRWPAPTVRSALREVLAATDSDLGFYENAGDPSRVDPAVNRLRLAENTLLRGARLAASSPRCASWPMSRVELAAEVRRRVLERTGLHVSVDKQLVGKWERGAVRCPTQVVRDALREILGVESDADLGFASPGGGGPKRSKRAASSAAGPAQPVVASVAVPLKAAAFEGDAVAQVRVTVTAGEGGALRVVIEASPGADAPAAALFATAGACGCTSSQDGDGCGRPTDNGDVEFVDRTPDVEMPGESGASVRDADVSLAADCSRDRNSGRTGEQVPARPGRGDAADRAVSMSDEDSTGVAVGLGAS
jgi:hypothetical protein